MRLWKGNVDGWKALGKAPLLPQAVRGILFLLPLACAESVVAKWERNHCKRFKEKFHSLPDSSV